MYSYCCNCRRERVPIRCGLGEVRGKYYSEYVLQKLFSSRKSAIKVYTGTHASAHGRLLFLWLLYCCCCCRTAVYRTTIPVTSTTSTALEIDSVLVYQPLRGPILTNKVRGKEPQPLKSLEFRCTRLSTFGGVVQFTTVGRDATIVGKDNVHDTAKRSLLVLFYLGSMGLLLLL